MRTFVLPTLFAAFVFASSCTSRDQEKAREDAHKAAAELKHDGRELSNNIDRAIQPDSRSAGDKLADGKAKLEAAGDRASVKLGRAALEAQVKTNLASEAGLSTITGIDVYANGDVVTLRGHVSSQAQKDAAERAAARVNGVSHVQNEISIDR
jgi:osmotically-inducible protein OsmY